MRKHTPPATTTPSMAGFLFIATLIATTILAGPAPAAAQMVRGRVIDASTGEGVEAAQVRLSSQVTDDIFTGLTNEIGLFAIEVDGRGAYQVGVRHIGYDSVSTRLVLVNDDLTYIDLRVAPAAVELPGLVITSRQQVPFLEARGFYERAKRGLGTFLGPEDLRSVSSVRTSELFRRIPGLGVAGEVVYSTRDNCVLTVFVDGILMNRALESVSPFIIDAIEIYKSAVTTPIRWRTGTNCGTLLIWTKY